MEVAMKLSRQYFLEMDKPQPERVRFIARNESYHGTTLGSLSMGGHKTRREFYKPMLLENVSHVSPCHAYRWKLEGETDVEYVQRLAQELEDEFKRVGPETVCAFVAEPVVGAVCLCLERSYHLSADLSYLVLTSLGNGLRTCSPWLFPGHEACL